MQNADCIYKDENLQFQEEPITASAYEAWTIFGDYVMNSREGRESVQ